jgi:hypothetical protein
MVSVTYIGVAVAATGVVLVFPVERPVQAV